MMPQYNGTHFPRYYFIQNRILKLLQIIKNENPTLLIFPLDMIKIIQSLDNVKLWSYQYYASKYNVTLQNTFSTFGSQSGCVKFDKVTKECLILFNKGEVLGRQKWTLAHELGHVFLDHLTLIDDKIIDNNSCVENKYLNLEKEADYFARTLLAPFPLFKILDIQSSVDIEINFGLSSEAAHYTFNSYSRWLNKNYKTSYNNDIIAIYKPYLS